MEAELVVTCECCGLKEDCTQPYITEVKAKFQGKWLCGLCSEAVRDEANRTNNPTAGLEEAVSAHMSFCRKFRANPAVRVADGMRLLLRRRSTDVSPSSSSQARKYVSSSQDLDTKLGVLQRELQGRLNGEIFSNCSYSNSMWEIDQEGMVLSSRCTMYKSATEAVSIWGWPLQTAGLLRTGFSQRSFTILSGRLTEWSDGGIGYVVREANTSWVQKRWDASAVQLDPQTWILEYRQSSILEDSSLNVMAADFFKHWVSKVIRRLKNELWLFLDVETKFHQTRHDFKTPT